MRKNLIVGCGAMGRGITYLMAKYWKDSDIHVVEPNLSAVEQAKDKMRKWQKKEMVKSEEKILSPFIERVKFFANFEILYNTEYDLLIEAVHENIETKKKIFAEFDKLSNTDSLIVSNTSSLSITKMATAISPEKRHQVVGLHFFNPPHIMELLEIIITELTSNETIEKAKGIGKTLQKKTVICKDAPGFITSRIGIIAINEAIFVLQEGLSNAEDIDRAMKLGYNHRMGPLKLADFIGLDVVFAVTQSLYENYQDPKYRPPLLLRKKVEANQLGMKTGEGFYKYPQSKQSQ